MPTCDLVYYFLKAVIMKKKKIFKMAQMIVQKMNNIFFPILIMMSGSVLINWCTGDIIA